MEVRTVTLIRTEDIGGNTQALSCVLEQTEHYRRRAKQGIRSKFAPNQATDRDVFPQCLELG